MLLYNLINNAKAMHVIYDAAGKAVVINAGTTTKDPIPLRDETAIAFRRMQVRGSALHIAASDRRGEEILEKAKEPLQRQKSRLYLSPNELKQGKVPDPIPIRDEVAEVEAAKPVEPVTPRRNRYSHRG